VSGAHPASTGEIFLSLPKCLQIPQWRTRELCRRVCDIFAGLMDATIWLKQGAQGMTDCERYLYVPLHDPEAYIITVHELSHWYFGSNMLARDIFVDDYTARLILRFKLAGSPIVTQPSFEEQFKELTRFLINVFDDHRCSALWGRIYPGDDDTLRRRWQRLDRDRIASGEANRQFFDYALCVSAGLGDEVTDPRPEFLAIRPVLEDGFRKVETVDFEGCLIVVRQTMDRILNVLLDQLEEQQKAIQNPFPSASSTKARAAQAMAAAALDDGKQKDPQGQDPKPQQGGQGKGKGQQDPKQGKQKPDVKSVDKRRATMLGLLTAMSKNDKKPGRDTERHGDVVPNDFQKRNKQKLSKAHALVNQSLQVNPHHNEEFDFALEVGRDEMVRRVEQARSHVQNVSTDDWLTKGSKCKIAFHDVGREELGAPVELTDEEKKRAQSMKVEFVKILGQKRHSLEDDGDEPNVQALIDRKLDPTVTEVFEFEEPGPGFYGLIVCDASGSMNNHKFAAVEKAEKMLRIAMEFPFVHIEKWLFTQKEKGQVDLFRVDPKLNGTARGVEAWGLTPMHEAIKVGARQCMLHDKVRRMFVLTDGAPVYHDFRGKSVSTDLLYTFCARNVAEARHNHVGTFGMVIGRLDDKSANRVFGHPKFWERAKTSDDICDALVQLVRKQFVEYLRTRH